MSEEAVEDWHNSPVNELTLRLGERFARLCQWSYDNDLYEELEIIYLLLGLTPSIVGIANLVEEFDHPESREILQDWGENYQADRIRRFASAFSESVEMSRDYAAISPRGTVDQVRRQFPELKKRTFLLTLYTYPLSPSKDPATFIERRRLRMWLAVQAAIRVVNEDNIADSSISRVSRFLNLGHSSPRWQFVDQLLGSARRFRASSPESFERFTESLRLAADQIYPDYQDDKAIPPVLNAIRAITMGKSTPYLDIEYKPKFSGHFSKRRPSPLISFETDDGEYELLPGLNTAEEQLEPTWVVPTDPTDSSELQQLKTNSFFIQRIESSHYLPWSYDGVLPPELPQLETWLGNSLASTDNKVALGAALIWMSCRLGRTLHFVQLVAVNKESGGEWALTPCFELAHRLSPRRQNSWQPGATTQQLVKPRSQEIRVSLPVNITKVLKKAAGYADSQVTHLAHLWQYQSGEPLESWFNVIARQHFPRITSAKLAQTAGLNAFQRTGDHNFSRVLTSHPNSGLPGACGYATWDIQTLEKGISLSALAEPGLPPNPNVMGSLLAPIEVVVENEIEEAGRRLKRTKDAGDWLAFHNQFAQYCVLALYAATGCRYLRDPFESVLHFNWQYRFVYINDKADEGLHAGRLVPLPERVVRLTQTYLNYLRKLAKAINHLSPNLADDLSLVIEGKSERLPLFFQLDGAMKWHSMGDTDLPGGALLNWDFPPNVFRHRFAQLLSQTAISTEVIDGWLGHAERGVSTYSDYSPRCWLSDASTYRRELNEVYERLPFDMDSFVNVQPDFSRIRLSRSSYSEPTRFGDALRKWNRSQNAKNAIRIAKNDIALTTDAQPLASLTAEGMERLVQRMLYQEGTLPHPYAGLRLRVLIKEAERSGGAARFAIKRRVAAVRPERALISPSLPRSMDTLDAIKAWATSTQSSTIKAKLSKRKALILGAVLFCIEKRISYLRMLCDISCGRHYRIIQHKRMYFLEYSEILDPGDFVAPIQRHEISYKVASFLCYGQGIKSNLNPDTNPSPAELNPLVELLDIDNCKNPNPHLVVVLRRLTRVIEQTNLVLFPGMVAGALSERSPPTSLPIQDYLRIKESEKRVVPIAVREVRTDVDYRRLRLNQCLLSEVDKSLLQEQAKQLFDGIHHLIRDYKKATHRVSAKAVEALCKSYEGKVSTTVLMLGHWLAFLMRRGYGRKMGSKPYALNTIETYFSRLNKAFLTLAYDVDLIAADEGEITQFYNNVLDFHRRRGSDTTYSGKRLKEFHQWASECGVDDPDWADIDIENEGRHVRPGVLCEADYQSCLTVLEDGLWGRNEERLFMGFLLLLTYRFGLRRNEALGLRKKDWCHSEDFTWVLIRNNTYRTLKSTSSRRAVPLLFPLSTCERSLIDNIMTRYDSLSGVSHSMPIFCEIHKESIKLTSMAEKLPTQVIELARQVTGNTTLVLHHCRHSFYNRLAIPLLGLDTPLTQLLAGELNREVVRRIVLGEQHATTRRSGMALARLVGHSLPAIGLKNYNHLLTDWADALTPVKTQRAGLLANAVSTKSFGIYKEKSEPCVRPISYQPINMLLILKTMRLASQGMGVMRAGRRLNLHPDDYQKIATLVDVASKLMRFRERGKGTRWINGEEYTGTVLDFITEAGWSRLIEWGGGVDVSDDKGVASSLDINDLPFLISRNRQILINCAEQCSLVIELFKKLALNHADFAVVVKNGDEKVAELLSKNGFSVISEGSYASRQLDPYPVVISGVEHRCMEYGGLCFERRASGVVRNSYELSVALLAYGALTSIFSA